LIFDWKEFGAKIVSLLCVCFMSCRNALQSLVTNITGRAGYHPKCNNQTRKLCWQMMRGCNSKVSGRLKITFCSGLAHNSKTATNFTWHPMNTHFHHEALFFYPLQDSSSSYFDRWRPFCLGTFQWSINLCQWIESPSDTERHHFAVVLMSLLTDSIHPCHFVGT
jgi:hypothetical protein